MIIFNGIHKIHKIHEILNAITMISPILALCKHRKSSSFMKKIMCIHIPISICYHIACALPILCNHPCKKVLRAMDFTCIHMTSLISSIETRNISVISCTQLLAMHAFVLSKTLKNGAIPLLQYALFFSDNMHLFGICMTEARKASIIGSAAFLFYLTSVYIPIGHSIFHITLYWLYDSYFRFQSQDT